MFRDLETLAGGDAVQVLAEILAQLADPDLLSLDHVAQSSTSAARVRTPLVRSGFGPVPEWGLAIFALATLCGNLWMVRAVWLEWEG